MSEQLIQELKSRVEALEKRGGIRGPAGDCVAAERLIGARITESANTLKTASDQAVGETKRLKDAVEAALAKVNAIAQRVEDRLNTLNERLSDENFLDHTILKVLAEYQIVQDGDVGDLLKYHIEKHVASLSEVKQ